MDAAGFRALLVVDVVDSTALAQSLGDEATAAWWSAHDRIARDLLAAWRGREIDKTDGFLLLFSEVGEAAGYALAYHRALAALAVPARARAGIHAAHVILRENRPDDVARGAKPIEVEGLAKATTARLASLATAGQTLVSAEACAAWSAQSLHLRSHGHWRLKGVADPVELFEVGDAGCAFVPPPDGAKAYRVVHREGEWVPVREIEHNLPQPTSSFVGRLRELAEVEQRLGEARLVTVLGTGGLGKTRLALQAARALLGEFADGAWLVELAPLSNPQQVPQAVASALRLKEEPGRPVLDSVLRHAASRELLIVLDNCEHVVEAAAVLAQRLLGAGAHLRVLATSREPLRVPGEICWPLAPLELPAGAAPDVTAAQDAEAVQLFVERARAVRPDFALNAANVAAVVEICRRLDAIPLAIELAAARVRMLSIEQIARRLDDRFRLLTGGDRTALPRQQTLRALIGWSYDLLSTPEQALLRRLAVFAGGWTLEAAEAVGADGVVARDQVVDLLGRLVERSLVAMESGGLRYRLLESVRAYALEHLERSGEGDATQTRHLGHYVDLAKRAATALWGPEQGAWVAQLDHERENVLLAHHWCDRAPDGARQGLLLVTKLQLYWMPGGLLEAGYRMTLEALGRAGAQVSDEARCGALYAASQLAYFLGRLDAAVAHGAESLAIARARGFENRGIDALLMMGCAADDAGRGDESERLFVEAIEWARRCDDQGRLSYALNGLGGRHMETDPEAGIPLFEESLQLAREVGDEDSVAVTLQNLARCQLRTGRFTQATERLREALQIALRIGATRPTIYVLDACAALAAASGDAAAAARFLGAADAQWQRIKVDRPLAERMQAERTAAQARARLASDAFAAHRTQGEALGLQAAAIEVDAWLAARASAC
ncbi:MAG TPA: tetratricopeptide repeat protein [Caldimonas sp.]|nr:tetratricopeptide repeat protein [Caldimonas sp.]